MNRRQLIAGAAIVSSAASSILPATAREDPASRGASLNEMLHPYLASHGLPALAAAAMQDGEIIASGAVGVRRSGSAIPVGINDRFHIGSDTKAMTSLLAGMLVEQEALNWTSTIGAVFPELAGNMDSGLREVTLEQLLSHTGGIPSDNEKIIKLLLGSYEQDGNLDELRYWLLKQWSGEPLASKPGTAFAYSNLGYTIAGAMIERQAKKTWEELIAERIFHPLNLETAGFGPQATLGRIDAPLGHRIGDDGTLKPILAGPNGDNPLIIGPAGTVHLSILDFAAWGAWHAGKGRRGPALVRPETAQKLHSKMIEVPIIDAAPGTPSKGAYCLGWAIASLPFASKPFLTHNGSNGMNLAMILLQPERDFGMVLATNVGGTKADAALKAAAGEIYGKFGIVRD